MELLDQLNDIVIEGKKCRKETRKLKVVLYEDISRDCDQFLEQLNAVETNAKKIQALLQEVVFNAGFRKAA